MEIIYLVTSNKNKVNEVKKIFDRKIETADLEIREIQSLEVEEVVKEKAKQAFEILKKTVITEDTGLYLDELNGFPGALIKWVLQTSGRQGICNLIKDNRTAVAKCSICFYDGKEMKVFTGKVKGKITEKPRGESSFGWDPVFQPEGYDKTFAEMSMEEKNKISHRKKALEKLKIYLKRNDF
ncbi:RdgB/HAM1 family non-canonical purine NTP pyrophosphatase [Candidatus Micrarchaeota archaeon]|jgi:XTP/dITP diphosphohydrolase|nr:RdgB/HAM1 family non-canonical purine NTP pyrophosphatase [Candidatus Micrarchaeota archaeon]